jgi:FtsH-binding integral membrane protein
VKILPIPRIRIANRPAEIGMRLATVALYHTGSDASLPYWADFSPYPVECATSDLSEQARVLASIPAEDWELLERSLTAVPQPFQPGFYLIDTAVVADIIAREQYTAEEQADATAETDVTVSEAPVLDTHIYCAGLPCVEERALTEEERAEINSLRLRAWRLTQLYLLGVLATVLVLVLHSTTHVVPAILQHPDVPLIAIILLLLVLLQSADQLRRMLIYRKELAAGTVRTFRGQLILDSYRGYQGYTKILVTQGLLKNEPEVIQTLQVMAGSGRLAYANGNAVARIEIANISSVAPLPAAATAASFPEWMHVYKTTEEGNILVNRRELSEEERHEMRTLADKTIGSLPMIVLLITAGLCYWIYYDVTHWTHTVFSSPIFYIGGLIILLFWRGLVLNLIAARRLRRSANLGFVVIFRGPEANPRRLRDVPETDDVVIEVLPYSFKTVWTINGNPTRWRKRGY